MAVEKVLDTGVEIEALERLPGSLVLPDVVAGRDKADAVAVPHGYLGVPTEYVRAAVINQRWRRVVVTDDQGRLWTKPQPGGFDFVTGDPRALLQFPGEHPFYPGQPRYLWIADPEDRGVKYGFLRFPA